MHACLLLLPLHSVGCMPCTLVSAHAYTHTHTHTCKLQGCHCCHRLCCCLVCYTTTKVALRAWGQGMQYSGMPLPAKVQRAAMCPAVSVSATPRTQARCAPQRGSVHHNQHHHPALHEGSATRVHPSSQVTVLHSQQAACSCPRNSRQAGPQAAAGGCAPVGWLSTKHTMWTMWTPSLPYAPPCAGGWWGGGLPLQCLPWATEEAEAMAGPPPLLMEEAVE